MVELAPSKYPVLVFPASLVVTAWASHILAKKSCWEICSVVAGGGSPSGCVCVCVCVCVLWAETSAFRGQTCSCEDVVLVQCQLFGDHKELTPRSPYSTLVLVDQKDGKSGVLDSLTCTHLLPSIFRDLRQVDSGRIRFSSGTAASKWLILPRLFTEAC